MAIGPATLMPERADAKEQRVMVQVKEIESNIDESLRYQDGPEFLVEIFLEKDIDAVMAKLVELYRRAGWDEVSFCDQMEEDDGITVKIVLRMNEPLAE